MNAVILAVAIMLTLSVLRVNVVLALFLGAIGGGLAGGLGFDATLTAFAEGLGGGASIAISYGMLGAFAMAISASGIPQWLADRIIQRVARTHKTAGLRISILGSILLMAFASQNVVPVHIAFIPILIPPLLGVFSSLQLDRRAVASTLSFGLIATYMLVPIGFGNIYLTQILAGNLNDNGLNIDPDLMPSAMALPVLGMFIGLLVAVFWTYRKPRHYHIAESALKTAKEQQPSMEPKAVLITLVSIAAALGVQLFTDSMAMGAATGFMMMILGGIVHWREADDVFARGVRMMALCGFIMISASGFAEVLRTTGDIPALVAMVEELVYGSKALAAFLMLLVGLMITMGIGSSFSTIPIIATLYVPLALALGFSPLATAALVGASGALGDAGSPASDSTIGPTAGLDVDGQHDHIRDTVIPTFMHYNIPMILFAWIAAMIL
ncbi:TRAP transporter large permease subunit [Thalassotalea sp. G20_0]|uniref:Na+/H+ antiporter family protein n=1 Tax=Thalassotalea sp. G20_0 TaxID=2821093 RepID=UPI001ADB4194|nr:Na+/H+ antiporter NhaC family protein [Thalassotalea sp. G20_0]MBO9496107.1 TRAP transporter large permease subunit [Thalassotalea sp. G20_0]